VPAGLTGCGRALRHTAGSIQPANTLVEARMVGGDYLVEIEAEAEVAGE
jgi:enamine deaminase RidA (YjgF/YER057c/UK114 family)